MLTTDLMNIALRAPQPVGLCGEASGGMGGGVCGVGRSGECIPEIVFVPAGILYARRVLGKWWASQLGDGWDLICYDFWDCGNLAPWQWFIKGAVCNSIWYGSRIAGL